MGCGLFGLSYAATAVTNIADVNCSLVSSAARAVAGVSATAPLYPRFVNTNPRYVACVTTPVGNGIIAAYDARICPGFEKQYLISNSYSRCVNIGGL